MSAFVGAIVGRRKSGKTYLLAQLLRKGYFAKYDFDFIVIFSPTLHLQVEFWKMVKARGIVIVKTMDNSVIKKIMKYQEENKDSGNVLLVFDDIGFSARVAAERRDSMLDELAFAGRHYRISIIQLAQRWTQLSTSMRSQLDWFYFFGSTNHRECNALHQEFSPPNMNARQFREMVSKLDADKHEVLLFENKNGKISVTLVAD